MEDRLGLTTKTRLLAVVTTLTLCVDGVLALLVLGDLVWSVLAALLALAVGAACLWDVDHCGLSARLLCVWILTLSRRRHSKRGLQKILGESTELKIVRRRCEGEGVSR